MVVSIDVCTILKVFQVFGVLILGVSMFIDIDKTPKESIRLTASCILLITNVLQIPIQIQIGESYSLNIILILLWFVSSLLATYSLGKQSRYYKKE